VPLAKLGYQMTGVGQAAHSHLLIYPHLPSTLSPFQVLFSRLAAVAASLLSRWLNWDTR
jgi:hypothetical protein